MEYSGGSHRPTTNPVRLIAVFPDSAGREGLWTDLPAAAYARSGEGGQGAEPREYARSGEGGRGAEQRGLWKNTLWKDLAAYARSGESGQDWFHKAFEGAC